jgi:hypothetical protein
VARGVVVAARAQPDGPAQVGRQAAAYLRAHARENKDFGCRP